MYKATITVSALIMSRCCDNCYKLTNVETPGSRKKLNNRCGNNTVVCTQQAHPFQNGFVPPQNMYAYSNTVALDINNYGYRLTVNTNVKIYIYVRNILEII